MQSLTAIEPARPFAVDRLRSVVCICQHGMRSAQVVAFRVQPGHGPVYNLAGVVDAWSRVVDAAPRY